ncbi:MAG: MAPEG family protein [Leptolyngbyaceae bacterium]|nr:MAPEG family protein [Leptolyngbyaceae bacterium]
MNFGSPYFLYAIAIATLLIYVPFMAVGYARLQVGYDMSSPRAMLEKLPPFAQRATWAHENAFEAFIQFSAAAFMAYLTGQQSELAIGAAIAHLVARLLYPLFYILDIPLLRSAMFAIGSLSTYTLFALSLLSVTR